MKIKKKRLMSYLLSAIIWLGIPGGLASIEICNNGISRSIDSLVHSRKPDTKLYEGIEGISNFRKEVIVYNNGVSITKKDKQIEFIDSNQDKKPEIYRIAYYQNKSMEIQGNLTWMRRATFNEMCTGFLLFPDSGIKIIENNSSLDEKIDKDYSILSSRGISIESPLFSEPKQRYLPLPTMFRYRGIQAIKSYSNKQ
ncbi:hypothetical protein HZA33_04110 [Candidatus Pacearchaeota archaeon]|nr:hypothetical protein [Candidatus Pacearchaeota archaeon]